MTHHAIITIDDGPKSSVAMFKKQPTYWGGEFTFEAPANSVEEQDETTTASTPSSYA